MLIDAWGLIFFCISCCIFCIFAFYAFFIYLILLLFFISKKRFHVFHILFYVFEGFGFVWVLLLCWFLKHMIFAFFATTMRVCCECSFWWRNTWAVPQGVSVYKYLYLMMLNNPSQSKRGDKQAKNLQNYAVKNGKKLSNGPPFASFSR